VNAGYSWIELRKMVLSIIAIEFARRTSIGEKRFFEIYVAEEKAPAMKLFLSQYLPDEMTLSEIFDAIAVRTGLDQTKVTSLFDRDENVVQFAERLLRSGALKDRGRENDNA